jgi:hypothetical protein
MQARENDDQEAVWPVIELDIVRLAEVKRGFVLLQRRRVVEEVVRLGGAVPPAGAGLRAAYRSRGGGTTSCSSAIRRSANESVQVRWIAEMSVRVALDARIERRGHDDGGQDERSGSRETASSRSSCPASV